MKTILILAALVLGTHAASAQKIKEAEVPAAIVSAFHENFKGTKIKHWEKEKNGLYEAEFAKDNRKCSATFAPDGAMMETETEMKASELPQLVLDIIAKDFAGYKISEVSKTQMPSGDINYETGIKKRNENLELVFDSYGNFIRKKE